MKLEKLRQRWPMPSTPLPIVSIGAGGIVRDAHYPAYRKVGFDVLGLHDANASAAKKTAAMFGVKRVFDSLRDAARERDVVFDVAVPADQILPVLRVLPERAVVLVQKPMGRDLAEAKRILALCRKKKLVAAINFQLRFSPNMLALADALERGLLGDVCDLDVRVNTYMPWHLWSFMRGIPRMEVLYHSIHYIDLIRSFIGEPSSVHAAAVPHPSLAEYSDVRTSAIFVYGKRLRCTLFTSHSHTFGPEHACSQILIEGTCGAAFAQMGVNLDYPRGKPDELAIALHATRSSSSTSGARSSGTRTFVARNATASSTRASGSAWQSVKLAGSWFPDAFIGIMSNLQRFAAGEDERLCTNAEDAVKTMALVEACYRSSARGGVDIPSVGRARRARARRSR